MVFAKRFAVIANVINHADLASILCLSTRLLAGSLLSVNSNSMFDPSMQIPTLVVGRPQRPQVRDRNPTTKICKVISLTNTLS